MHRKASVQPMLVLARDAAVEHPAELAFVRDHEQSVHSELTVRTQRSQMACSLTQQFRLGCAGSSRSDCSTPSPRSASRGHLVGRPPRQAVRIGPMRGDQSAVPAKVSLGTGRLDGDSTSTDGRLICPDGLFGTDTIPTTRYPPHDTHHTIAAHQAP